MNKRPSSTILKSININFIFLTHHRQSVNSFKSKMSIQIFLSFKIAPCSVLYDVVNIQRKKIVTDTTDTARNRRSGVSATINNIHQNAENINHESQKGKKFALPSDYTPTAADCLTTL